MTKKDKFNISGGLILMLLIVVGLVLWYIDGEAKKQLRGGFKLSKTSWNISKFLAGKQQAGFKYTNRNT